MDLGVRKELSDLLETLTHSGSPSLDDGLLKKVKHICKSNDLYIRVAFEILMKYIEKEHAEIRLSSFQVLDQLFQRSHSLRQLLCADFQKIISLVSGVDPLPPPQNVATKLKEQSLLTIKQWVEKYGDGYPKLKLGYNYLKYNKKVDFDSLVAISQGEQHRREERERRQRAFLQQRLEEVKSEMRDQLNDIRTCLMEMESCFQIVMPNFGFFADIPSTSQSQSDPTGTGLRTVSTSSESFCSIEGQESEEENEDHQTNSTQPNDHKLEDVSDSDSEVEWEEMGVVTEPPMGAGINGLLGRTWNVTVEIPHQVKVIEGIENDSLIETLKERHQLLTKTYLPRITKWIEWFTKAGEDGQLKQAIDLKAEVLAAKDKYSELHIINEDEDEVQTKSESISETPCSSMNVRGSVPWATSYLREPKSHSVIDEELTLDPTTPQAQIVAKGRKDVLLSSKEGLNKEGTSSISGDVPLVPYDMDLVNWGTNTGAPDLTPTAMDSLHRYWCQEPDIQLSDDFQARLKCRTITFAGQFEPVKWSCRAPLPSGNLCPRRDRYKCPLHGTIVPRDEQGQPVLQTEASSSTRLDLSIPSTVEQSNKKGKKRKARPRKHPGLTNLSQSQNTPKSRLEKKVLNKRALARVGQKLDSISTKNSKSKFADNFNYALRS